jgi:hypothetical protein
MITGLLIYELTAGGPINNLKHKATANTQLQINISEPAVSVYAT